MHQAGNPTQIIIGTPVTFDSDAGPQAGTVDGFKSDLSNGRRVAVIRVPGTLDGERWHMPIEQLQHAAAAT